jgi:AcrR family transcriptional regulator
MYWSLARAATGYARAMVTRAESKAQTREALVLAGLELFAEGGLDGPSLDAICARAERTRGAFYVHFRSRRALIVAVTERILAGYLEVLGEATDAEDVVERFARLLTAALADDPDLEPALRLGTRNFRLVIEAAARDPALHALVSELLDTALTRLADLIGTDVSPPPEAVARTLLVVLIGLLAFPHGGVEGVEAVRSVLRGWLTTSRRSDG